MATKRPSKAAVRRRMKELSTETPAPPLPAAVEDLLAGYTPRSLTAEQWERCRPFVLDALARSRPDAIEAARQRLVALVQFAGWAMERDYALDRKVLLTADRIEAFTATAVASKSTAQNYRSKLRGIANIVNPVGMGPQVATRIAKRTLKAPYTAREVAAIVRIARTQPSPKVGRQLRACVGLGLGAGLDSQDLKDLRVRQVVDHGRDGIRIDVTGPRPRSVWVRADHEELVRSGLEGLKPGSLVIGTKTNRKHVASKVFEAAHILGDAPAFEQSRMRTTWLATLLQDRLPLAVIMDAAGLHSARTLTEIVTYLDRTGHDGREVR